MRLFSELRRRNVFRVAALYIISAWLVLQVAGVLADLLPLPDWFGPAVFAILTAGLPVALVLAWFYKLTPQGISRESDAGAEISIRQVTGRRMDFIIIALLSAALILSARQVLCDMFCPPDEAVCVLPFDSLVDDPQHSATAAGFAEEIHHQLLQSGGIKVLPRNSCLELKDGDVAELVRKLGVGYLVLGGIREFRERVRIAVQLVQVADGTHCWSKVYDEDLTDDVSILDLQTKIAELVVAEIHIPCLPGSRPDEKGPSTENVEAFTQYLIGLARLEKSVTIDTTEATGYFEKAIELDPGFADAYAALAFVTASEPARSRELSLKALELDSQLALARATLAASYETDEPRRARTEFDRALDLALDLDKNNLLVWELFGDYLAAVGDPAGALELYRSGLELVDPLAIRLYFKTACLLESIDRAEEAEDYRHKAAEIEPEVDLTCDESVPQRPDVPDTTGETS